MGDPRSDRWLLVAALAAEILPPLLRLAEPRIVDPRLVAGRLAGREVALLRVGVGAVCARRRTEAALARWDAARVVSFGTCGALADGLAVGDVVAATRLLDHPAQDLLTVPGARPVVLTTVPRAVRDPVERARLAARGAEACEMEAAGVLDATGAPRRFAALKVVSDLAGRDGGRILAPLGRFPFLRFKSRALALVRDRLLPILEDLLRTAP
ncbi:MAG: hypothetical protein JXB39_04320 [Deltaproteobacteria bacterium]|nr:hypothetical protein [Deltaproteobacteria bacterium]